MPEWGGAGRAGGRKRSIRRRHRRPIGVTDPDADRIRRRVADCPVVAVLIAGPGLDRDGVSLDRHLLIESKRLETRRRIGEDVGALGWDFGGVGKKGLGATTRGRPYKRIRQI